MPAADKANHLRVNDISINPWFAFQLRLPEVGTDKPLVKGKLQ
jgi:hypothetical protein